MELEIIKECPKHGEAVFYYDSHAKKYRCKICRAEAVVDTRRRNKLALIEYKGGKCQICGYDKCIDALEFHHLNQAEKKFGLSNGDIRSLAKLKKEADKCILICANCHRELHAKEREKERNLKEEKEKESIRAYIANHASASSKSICQVKLEQVDWNEIRNRINNGATFAQLSDELGVSCNTLRRSLKKRGLEYTIPNAHKLANYTVEELKEDLAELHNFSAVGRKRNVCNQAIKKFCVSHGLPCHLKDLIKYFQL